MPDTLNNPLQLFFVADFKAANIRGNALSAKLDSLLVAHNNDWQVVKPLLAADDTFKAVLPKLDFTHSLASWSGNNTTLITAFQADVQSNSMRDVALNFNREKLLSLVKKDANIPLEEQQVVTQKLHTQLFQIEPTAVLINMVKDPQVPMLNNNVGASVSAFLENQPDFNIKTTSVYEALKAKDAFKDIDDVAGVTTQLKNLQRMVAISPVPEAVPMLYQAKLHTALQVATMPLGQFTAAFQGKLPESELIQLHQNAQYTQVRNEQTLMAFREVGKGTGIAMIDKNLAVGEAMPTEMEGTKQMAIVYNPQQVAKEAAEKHNLSWDLLFADADFCECGECTSVYSAAAYYVELLQYLRNNNLDPDAIGPTAIKANPKDISGTPLEKFFARRPDLGCLELTCKNTHTILPYIDLVNEVMEHYVAFKKLKPFNVEDETSGELLSEPQHTEYQAYCILKKEVYPFTLPYHQPIDAARIYLNYLDTSRYEVIDTFRKNNEGTDTLLTQVQDEHLDRAADAEFLNITKEEYVILTKESFESRAFKNKHLNKTLDDTEYQKMIGVKPLNEYYGYPDASAMMAESGIKNIKKEFLRRTGIDYFNLVDLLKTEYINPCMPKGKSKAIMESLHFSYRFLQNYAAIHGIDKMANDLVKLENFAAIYPQLKEVISILSNQSQTQELACPDTHKNSIEISDKDVICWVKCHFEKIGKLIVIESGKACINGRLILKGRAETIKTPIITVKDCIIYFSNQKIKEEVGTIDKITGEVKFKTALSETQLKDFVSQVTFVSERGEQGAFVVVEGKAYLWMLNQQDNCNLDTAILQHLDGTPLIEAEYDRIHHFLRLWRKMGWTIDETDKAIVGLSGKEIQGAEGSDDESCCDECADDECNPLLDDCEECRESTHVHRHYDINPALLHQLVAVKQLLDHTGLDLIKLLAFWTEISTAGDKSLYQRLFLTHNLTAMDKVFKADATGNFLTTDEKITTHLPVLMAAFNLSADDLAMIMTTSAMEDKLTLNNVSVLYRYRLLSKTLGLKIPAFIGVLPLFGNVFQSAHATLAFMKLWQEMEDVGFTHQQLNYIILNNDDERKPFAPTQKTILLLAKTLYDGLNAIEETHKDLVPDATATTDAEKQNSLQSQATLELIKAKASLLYDTTTVEKIITYLEGTTLFLTNAPKNLVAVLDKYDTKKDADPNNVPPLLKILRKKTKYHATQEKNLQITGMLTPAEKNEFLAWGNSAEWNAAVERIIKQQNKLFKELLSGIFEEEKTKSAAEKTNLESILKEGDISIPLAEIPAGQADTNTAPKKRQAFLALFLPYLRQELTHRFVIDTLSNAAKLERKTTDLLLTEVLKISTKPIYTIFENIKDKAQPSATDWHGYLIPSATNDYTFIVRDSAANPTLGIEGANFTFIQQEDPTNEWWSHSIRLEAGKLYLLAAMGLDLKNVYWKTPTSTIANIPTSSLIPDFASAQCTPAFISLQKAAMIVNGFALSTDEIQYLDSHKADFDNIDFNAITLVAWQGLEAYTRLRNSLPTTKLNILDFWKWANDAAADATQLSEKIAILTNWKKARIDKLVAVNHYNITQVRDFKNEINLLKLQNALTVADKIGVDIDLLFEWAVPTSKFSKCRQIADSIKNAIRAKYNQTDWEQVVKPLHDQLRNNQKNALIAYLLQRQELIDFGVTDADGLFEYFLIDVQMEPCMETSRIKQAINSVQLFVQRCFLGLEKGISVNALDRPRWEWMQRYRVWEANRKVFLYPENWIESNLRDDKSPFFKELESELLQKDITKDNVQDALKNYLYKVDEVANMEVVGLYIDGIKSGDNWSKGAKLHVFSRTRNAPYFFFYRYLALDEMNWYAWEKMQVDIPSYDTSETFDFNWIKFNGNPNNLNKVKITSIDFEGNRNVTSLEYDTFDTGGGRFKGRIWDLGVEIKGIKGKIDGTIFYRKENNATIKDRFLFGVFRRDVNYNGCYLTPYVWNNRLLIFFPQFMKKTRPNPASQTQTIRESSDNAPDSIKPIDYWEIKMAFSEYRNGKWTQKQLSKDHLVADIIPGRAIDQFSFIPKKLPNGIIIHVEDTWTNDTLTFKGFTFSGSNFEPDNNIAAIEGIIPTGIQTEFGGVTIFQKVANKIQSLQLSDNGKNWANDDATFIINKSDVQINYSNANLWGNFYHSFTDNLLKHINTGQLSDFFKHNLNLSDNDDAFGAYGLKKYNELKRPYSLYNWELFFHTPMALANELSKAQHFEEAMKWYHFVFSPLAEGTDDTRFWQFLPFKEADSKRILDNIFNNLKPNEAYKDINEWRNKPFMPHVVARGRSVAYMKWVVMKYLDNLMAWGDYLYRQDTIESINQATQLYILASHILGPRPMMIPKRGKVKPQTYLSLLDRWDAFGNAMVELELAIPFSNQTTMPLQKVGNEIAFANVFGFSTTLYFCIPNNPKLMGYWDTLADRLFKIRHCQNIEGVFRKLPLFEPPIDPALLVKAAAQGLSIASVLNDLNTPMPNYRFYYLLQKALELCGELKSLGGAMLSAMEKRDNETLSVLRSKHENTMNNLVMEVKKLQLDEAQKSLITLRNNRKAPEERMKYFLKLAGLEESLLPSEGGEFNGLPNEIVTIDGGSGLKLNKYEDSEMDWAFASTINQIGAGVVKTLAGIIAPIPDLKIYAAPFGAGAATNVTGGQKLSKALNIASDVISIASTVLSHQSASAGKKAGFTRALQDRIQQANAAGYEIKQIDKQITAQQVRIDIANKEIANQQQQIDNAKEVEEFLKNKYSNEELYTWMRDSLRTLYRQVYNLAYELAKKAEKTYRFERGLSGSNFIQAGYWDAGRDGLLSGEQLYVGLKQLEAAYQENRGYDYEITKHVSLRHINPLAILELRETGKCEFALPELLFDMDYPGHYKRRIKSVSISIPCIAGPYTGVNATLRLLENKFRNTAIGGKNYVENIEESDERFSSFIIPISAIAASSAQNDGGMFELNFKDERYLPFEGAGCISKWRLELPTFRQFDYNTISDAIIHIRYTAIEGGERLGGQARKSVEDFIKSSEDLARNEGLFSIIDLRHDLATEWHKAVTFKDEANPDAPKIMDLSKVKHFLPFYAAYNKDKIKATNIIIATDINGTFALNEEDLSPSVGIGELKTCALSEQDLKLENWKLTLPQNIVSDKSAWMVIRFIQK
ncbi:MAG TPA: hypothetical protein DCM71_14170 [Runella sp.]|nr:hypothetical protein [Runella sp.]